MDKNDFGLPKSALYLYTISLLLYIFKGESRGFMILNHSIPTVFNLILRS